MPQRKFRDYRTKLKDSIIINLRMISNDTGTEDTFEAFTTSFKTHKDVSPDYPLRIS